MESIRIKLNKKDDSFSELTELAQKMYKCSNFKEAVEAFSKAIEIKGEWYLYNGLGRSLIHLQQHEEAVETFKSSLLIKEHWSTYQGLGFALLYMNEHEVAIEAFNKSISMHKDWQSFQAIAWCHLKRNNYRKAILPLQRSIDLNQHWNSYKGLGMSLLKIKKFKEAIEPLSKSLAMHDDMESYDFLVSALINSNKFRSALDVYNKSLEINKNHTLNQDKFYSQVAMQHRLLGRIDASTRSWEIHFSYVKPILSIDPFLGNEKEYEKTDNHNLEQIKAKYKENGYEFHPSFEYQNTGLINSWRYLMYLHIPKCGGTSFVNPINQINQTLETYARQTSNTLDLKPYLATSSLSKDTAVAALVNNIAEKSSQGLNSAFFAPHGVPWKGLYDQISMSVKTNPRIITTIRDPHQRLLSQLKMHATNCESINDLYSIVNKSIMEFDNTIHRYIYYYGLKSHPSFNEVDDKPGILNPIDHIDFIDILDNKTLSEIKSAYLSASFLPNILQSVNLNDSKERERLHPYLLREEEIDTVFQWCLSRGFLERDKLIDYESLKKTTLSRLEFPSFCQETTFGIHPFTFIVNKDLQYQIVWTKRLLNDPLYFL